MDSICVKKNSLIQATLATEADAIRALATSASLLAALETTAQSIHTTQGKVIVTALGKSGIIGHKIAATLASTGTPSLFMHASEANHGDLGLVQPDDLVLAISSSGETTEILSLIPRCQEKNIPVIALTNQKESTLFRLANLGVHIPIAQEACPLQLAPTVSTTTLLAVGDALAMRLQELKQKTREDFAWSHPSGSLGKKLLLKVSDMMHCEDQLPLIGEETSLNEALIVMTTKRLGVAIMIDKQKRPLGIFTDGDLRRALPEIENLHTVSMKTQINTNFLTISRESKAQEALELMRSASISVLPVLHDDKLVGVIHMHDIIKAGFS